MLQKLTDTDLSNKAFPWLSGRDILVGWAPVRALRVNFVGELGWELHHPLAHQIHLWERLMEAGAEFDIQPFGIRAMDSLRIEKSYKYWRVDLSTEYMALEAGLSRFVQLNKGPFVGSEALVRQQQQGLPRTFVTLACEVKDADPLGNEPIWQGKRMVGRATSGAYGYTGGQEPGRRLCRAGGGSPRHEAGDRDLVGALRGDGYPRLAVGSGECEVEGVSGELWRPAEPVPRMFAPRR